jgi:nucleoside phosphorylase
VTFADNRERPNLVESPTPKLVVVDSDTMSTFRHEDYKVGWICPLPIEGTAAMEMLDEEHPSLPQEPNDPNAYTLGCIGVHNVVIASSPSQGTNSATAVAAEMMHSFRSIRYRLLVGIGAGVPNARNNIRLGDVFVGEGVVQHDFGKIEEQGFRRTRSLIPAPPALLSVVRKLQAREKRDGNSFTAHLSKFKDLRPEQGMTVCEHEGGSTTCEKCEREMGMDRSGTTADPVVHYGNIASGNSVIKNAKDRDDIGKALDVQCFEMEGAGLIYNYPALVIRGISDYADSNKNGRWKQYAAFAAAAYTKELITVLPEDLISMPSVRSPFPTHGPALQSPASDAVVSSPSMVMARHSPQSFFSILNRLLSPESVALGRLVINTRAPWHDFCPAPIPITRDDVVIPPTSQLCDILNSSRGSRLSDWLSRMFSYLVPGEDCLDRIGSAPTKTYLLSNHGRIFEKHCVQLIGRGWFETIIKLGADPYMVVGFSTVHESSIRGRDLEFHLPHPGVPNAGSHAADAKTAKAFLPADGELIVAVQYRKVQWGWFSSRDFDSAFLETNVNRWKVFVDDWKDPSQPGEDDVVEVSLQDSIVEEDVTMQGEVVIEGDQIFVLSET